MAQRFSNSNTVQPCFQMKLQAVKTNTENVNVFSAHSEPEELVAQSPWSRSSSADLVELLAVEMETEDRGWAAAYGPDPEPGKS